MKRVGKALLALMSASFMSPLMASNEQTSTKVSDSKAKKPFHGALGEGQTLPENVWRFRYATRSYNYNKSIDEKGKLSDSPIHSKVMGSAAVVEYGVTSKLSLQLKVPYVMSSRVSVDKDKFRQSKRYKDALDANLREKIVPGLMARGTCQTVEKCLELLKSNYRSPISFEKNGLNFKNSVELQRYVDAAIMTHIPKGKKTGLGDVEVGALYNLIRTEDWIVSTGVGLRLPTGEYRDVPAEYVPAGNGHADIGFRFNVDYQPVYGVWLSAQEQVEFALTDAKRRVSDSLDTSALTDEEQTKRKVGATQEGFLKASHGLGIWHENLKAFVVNANVAGRIDSKEKIRETGEISPQAQNYTYGVGASADGRGYGVPLALDVDYDIPFAGKNRLATGDVMTVTLKAYARF